MLLHRELEALRMTAIPPRGDMAEWLSKAADGIEFLKENAESAYVVLYASLGMTYIHSVLAPVSALTPANSNELMAAHLHADTGWCIQQEWSGEGGRKIYLQGPVRGAGCGSIEDGEQVVFRRGFPALRQYRPVVELSQRLVQALDLHFLPERNAYCRLDDKGDLQDVIFVTDRPSEDPYGSECSVLIMAKPLAEYMAVTGQALYRKFDFNRYIPGNFHGWHDQVRSEQKTPDLFYSSGVMPGHASYASGGQVIRTPLTVDDMVREAEAAADTSQRRYESFKIIDRKNGRLVECSCGPDGIVNYFTASDKPWEISPAFFRPEILARFKADPDKYELTDRSITCRNAWHLKTYDINEAGQVHTYIGYLGDLPHEEQQYWKLFNEWPQANISKRAYENDILGEWASNRDPLQSIKQTVQELDRAKPRWWKPRGAELAERVLVPVSDSAKEWADEILALDQLVVEGFIQKAVRSQAANLGIKMDEAWASLRLVEAILVGLGMTDSDAKDTMAPLRRLHHLRSKVKGHNSPDERRQLQREAISQHGSYRLHFLALCEECDDALISIDQNLSQAEKLGPPK